MQYLVSYCLYYVLKDKTSENSAKKGAYLNAYFLTFLNPGSSTNSTHTKVWIFKNGPYLKNNNLEIVNTNVHSHI